MVLPTLLKGTQMITLVDEFFDTSEFAQLVMYEPVSGSTSNVIPAIYDTEYTLSSLGDIQFQNSSPSVMCKSVDVLTASTRSMVTVNGVVYFVKEVQPDGTGITKLTLSKNRTK